MHNSQIKRLEAEAASKAILKTLSEICEALDLNMPKKGTPKVMRKKVIKKLKRRFEE